MSSQSAPNILPVCSMVLTNGSHQWEKCEYAEFLVTNLVGWKPSPYILEQVTGDYHMTLTGIEPLTRRPNEMVLLCNALLHERAFTTVIKQLYKINTVVHVM